MLLSFLPFRVHHTLGYAFACLKLGNLKEARFGTLGHVHVRVPVLFKHYIRICHIGVLWRSRILTLSFQSIHLFLCFSRAAPYAIRMCEHWSRVLLHWWDRIRCSSTHTRVGSVGPRQCTKWDIMRGLLWTKVIDVGGRSGVTSDLDRPI